MWWLSLYSKAASNYLTLSIHKTKIINFPLPFPPFPSLSFPFSGSLVVFIGNSNVSPSLACVFGLSTFFGVYTKMSMTTFSNSSLLTFVHSPPPSCICLSELEFYATTAITWLYDHKVAHCELPGQNWQRCGQLLQVIGRRQAAIVCGNLGHCNKSTKLSTGWKQLQKSGGGGLSSGRLADTESQHPIPKKGTLCHSPDQPRQSRIVSSVPEAMHQNSLPWSMKE